MGRSLGIGIGIGMRGTSKKNWGLTPDTPTVTINSNTSLTIDWVITGLDKEVTAVELWHSTDGTTYTRLVKLGAVATYDHDGLENNSIHYYKVRYWSGVYVSGFSGVVSGRTYGGVLDYQGDAAISTITTDEFNLQFYKNRTTIPLTTNPCFNYFKFLKNTTLLTNLNDDTCPTNININNYMGANHGHAYVRIINSVAHGKTYVDIGSEWINDSGYKFYIIRIIDADSLVMMGQSYGSGWYFEVAATGNTMTHSSGATHTDSFVCTTVKGTQLKPSIKINTSKIYVDDVEITEIDSYNFHTIKIEETYDIIDPLFVRNAIIANVGNYTDNPIFNEVTSEPAITVTLKYIFNDAYTNITETSYLIHKTLSMGYLGFLQGNYPESSNKIYIPGLLPITIGTIEYDFRTGVNTSIILGTNVDSVSSENEEIYPYRWLSNNNDIMSSEGYIFDSDVVTNRTSNTNRLFYLRDIKAYLYGVNNYYGTLSANDVLSAVTYKKWTEPESVEGRLCLNTFVYEGAYYIYIDYDGTLTDAITINPEYANGTLTLFEKSDNVAYTLTGGVLTLTVTESTPQRAFFVGKITL